MQKKKILYIVLNLRTSGPINWLYNLTKCLDRNKFEPSILTLTPEPELSNRNLFESISVPVSTLNLSRFNAIFKSKNKVQIFIEQEKPDIIHSSGSMADIIHSSLSFSGKKACTIHNFPQFDYIKEYGKIVGGLLELVHMRSLKKFDVCIGCSKSVFDNLVSHYKINNSNFVCNGIDTDIFHKVDQDTKLRLRQTLDLPHNAKIWLSVGTLSQRKDPIAIIDAFDQKYCNDAHTVLLFLGNGPIESQIQKRIENVCNIFLKGNVSNVSDYLKAGDYFVSASHAEGLPNSVLEALGCGLPVLLSDIAPHKEFFKMNAEIGTTYVLGDKTSFLNAFDYIERADYKTMSDNACRLVSTELSAKTMSDKYQRIYDDEKNNIGVQIG